MAGPGHRWIYCPFHPGIHPVKDQTEPQEKVPEAQSDPFVVPARTWPANSLKVNLTANSPGS